METLEEEQWLTSVHRLAAKISFPTEIIEDILSRLPAKSILRFRSVSKPWLSLISDPSFTKLHFTRATVGHRIAFYFSAYDDIIRKQYFLSAAHDGGPVTHLMTLDNTYSSDIVETIAEGLVCFVRRGWVSSNRRTEAFVFNPSTRKIFKVPYPTNFASRYMHISYLFGFDEARNEHKILHIRKVLKSGTIEFMIFSMSTHSWRKIDVELPIGFCWDSLRCKFDAGVCVNSVVHVKLQDLNNILAFDLKTEKLSIISIPRGVMLYKGDGTPRMMLKMRTRKINGCLTVVDHNRAGDSSEIDICMLQDYENHVWVRETIKLPEPWVNLRDRYLIPEDVNMEDDMIFSSSKSKAPESVMIVLVYNKKSGCFKLLRFTLGRQFPCSNIVKFNHIKCFVESIMPL